eukprot:TRINITY_DN69480_c0_g1_i1.p1 TRINITY_DN69480_c0_g1~~TRINITY_DN69480_c0_g1_i1.p1  ORF type:complete len:543 (+),score=80.74 TRINITY_DN69480_c0_g1_i1:48-1631(+)
MAMAMALKPLLAGLVVDAWATPTTLAPAAKRHNAPVSGGALERYPPTVGEVRAWVDNFDPSRNDTFSLRFLTYSSWWSPGGPIFLYLGNEGPIDEFYNNTGAIFEHSEALGARVVFVEHRYYGKSHPYGDSPLGRQEMGGLTIEQAMADYAWFVKDLRRQLACRDSECPIVTFGGSYGGMLVVWFRQKYPQLTVGGVGCGAVIDFYQHTGRQQAFWNATRHTFNTFGKQPGCVNLMEQALDRVRAGFEDVSGPQSSDIGLGSCQDLVGEPTASAKVDMFFRGIFSSLAMLDYTEASTFVTPLPANPVAATCRLLEASESNAVAALRAVADFYLNASGGFRCYDYMAEAVGTPTSGRLLGPLEAPDMGPWQYQACTELPMQTLTSDGFGFYPPADNQFDQVAATCQLRFGVTPRPDWAPLSLGASDLRVGGLFLSDGEKDPWRTGSVDMNKVHHDLDIVHHVIPAAAHHEDLRFDADPPRPQVQFAKRLAREKMRAWIGATPRVTSRGNVDSRSSSGDMGAEAWVALV